MAATEAKEVANNIFFNYNQPLIGVCISDYVSPIKYSSKPNLISGFVFDTYENDESTLLKPFFEILEKKSESYGALIKISKKSFTNTLNKIIDSISELEVENLKLQPTFDESILFTFVKGNVNHYLEFFPNYKNDEIDEVVLTSFEGDELIINYSGNLKYALKNVASQSDTTINIFSVTISNNASTISQYLTT